MSMLCGLAVCSGAVLVMLCVGKATEVAGAAPNTQPHPPPTIAKMGAIEVAGVATFGHPSDGRFSALWAELDPILRRSPGLRTGQYAYGIELYPPNWREARKWGYLVACEVEDQKQLPAYLVRSTLPAGTYAVFKVPGGIGGIPATYDFIYHTWLPNSDYELAAPLDLERHHLVAPDAPPSTEHVVEILLPVKRKG